MSVMGVGVPTWIERVASDFVISERGSPATFAGLTVDQPILMGVINITPDSFSDGGALMSADAAIAHGRRLIAEGAAILDIGGESTRPGAAPVTADEERRRVLPVVEGLRGAGAVLSIDTYKAETMEAALDAGAAIVNDVFALTKGALAVVAWRKPWLIIGHSKGEPGTMNLAPDYVDVVAEGRDYLASRLAACAAAGLPRERIALDPGLGFGKQRRHNLALLHGLEALAGLGGTLCVGASRKFAPKDVAAEVKLSSSIAAAVIAAQNGAHILRVHDVAATRAALAIVAPAAAGAAPLERSRE